MAETAAEDRVISLGHTGDVRCVALSADGSQAVSGSDDGTVRVWDTATGACLHVLEGHTAGVLSVALSADGSCAVSGSDDNTVRVWDTTTGTGLRVLEDHSAPVLSVAVSADATKALSGSGDHTVRAWDLALGVCANLLEGHEDAVWSVALSADSTRAVSASGDHKVRVWDLATGTCQRVLEGHTDSVFSVALSSDGTGAVSGSDDNTVRVWDVASGACQRVLDAHVGGVFSVALSVDGTQAVSASGDRTVRVWDLATGTCQQVLEAHTGGVLSVALSADSTQAVSASDDRTVRVWDLVTGNCQQVLEGHTGNVWAAALSADGNRAASASEDCTVRVWDLATGACQRVLEGHTGGVVSVGLSVDGSRAASGSDDRTVRVWDVATGACQWVLKGHAETVESVALSADGTRAASGSLDDTVRVWDLVTGTCQRVLEGHTNAVWSVTLSADGTRAVSGSVDNTVRVWDLSTGTCQQVLEGHTGGVSGVALSTDGTRAVSASDDNTVRVWDLTSGTCQRVLEGHTGTVWSIALSADGTQAASGSSDRTVRVWDLETGTCQRVLEGHTDTVWSVSWFGPPAQVFSAAENGVARIWPIAASAEAKAQATYTNAKVVLVGESQAGKTGLAMRLAHDTWELTESTIGAWATQMEVPVPAGTDGDREVWLWDFGGQADQRLIQQLYLGDAALAVFVFDGQREDAMARLWDWSRALQSAGPTVPRLLVAARTDANPVRLSRVQIDEFCTAAGFAGYLETSAKSGSGCGDLRSALLDAIDWERTPRRTSPVVFKRLKDEILRLKDGGRVLTTVAELREWLPARTGPFEPAELEAVLGLLAGPGAVQPLGFGGHVLLVPELLNAYAQAVIQSLRDDPLERGCITEERVLRGDLTYPPGFKRLPPDEERIVLQTMHRQLVERAICLRDRDPAEKRPTVLVFPSYFRRERPERPGRPQSFMTFRFTGFLDEIYASLVVRLHHTEPFDSTELWRNAADFRSATGHELGLRLLPQADGSGEIEVYGDAGTPAAEQVLFARYVRDHLKHRDADVVALRTYICPTCGTPANRETARRRLLRNEPDIGCGDCEFRIPLWDDIAQQFESEEVRRQVEELRKQSQIVLDNEGKERLLVGEVIAIAAQANQISRELTTSDHGIDMEIEFKDDDGRATGRKLYLQLKSGDSHLRATKRGVVFDIDKPRHAEYWANQAFPVMLVVRDSKGTIEWMEVRELLRANPATRQIVFEGEPFDVASVLRWRG